MIVLGIGANLPTVEYGDALSGCRAVVQRLRSIDGIAVIAASRWYRSAPVPASDQPWFVNGVVSLKTDFLPETLLTTLHGVEESFGRTRGAPNAARAMDMDILCYGEMVVGWGDDGSTWKERIVLPHPRMHERAFVLLPMAEIAPEWRHPVLGLSVKEMIANLSAGQMAEVIEGSPVAE